jgi:hypothetical protein
VAGLTTFCQCELADSMNWPSINMRIRGAATVMDNPDGSKVVGIIHSAILDFRAVYA